ncbi:MAG: putative 60 kDa inner membrane insertion protein [Parcubacteria group bacterium Licking1014_1]|nr:MAG: putative 60 kDa inner membrane insertion protein [Parcubacteria group bacterium Licking1014_1]
MFEFLINIFDIFLYRPLFNFLVLLYNFLPGHDFGVAVILLTVIIRIILYPVSAKALSSQKILQKLQPEIQEIQKKHKDNKEKQAKEVFELYKKEKINPFNSLFLALIQLPILIALYRVFWLGLKPEELVNLYKFISNPVYINANFLGLADLSRPNWILALLAGILQFFQTKILMPQNSLAEKKGADFSQIMQKQMLYFFPALTVVILLNLPSAIGLYWTVSGIFSIVQQYFALKKNN